VLPYNRLLKQPARTLRRNMTDGERRLWSRLRQRKLAQTQFYRQKPIGNYIVDFYAASAKLVVEVDGVHHLDVGQLQQDQERTACLEQLGLCVIRFSNLEVLQQLEEVVEKIARAVEERRRAAR